MGAQHCADVRHERPAPLPAGQIGVAVHHRPQGYRHHDRILTAEPSGVLGAPDGVHEREERRRSCRLQPIREVGATIGHVEATEEGAVVPRVGEGEANVGLAATE